jgi:hypothetical protein
MEIIEKEFYNLSITSSDINEHLPTLKKYASECESVFETGVRGCVSSWALAYGLLQNNYNKKKLLMNDITSCDIQKLLNATQGLPIQIDYIWKNNLDLLITDTFDLTFIDTWHVYGQLKRELAKFAPITNKYIIMHDTTVDEWLGENIRMGFNSAQHSLESGFPIDEINKGIWYAIEEFLDVNKEWVLHERYINNNGLTILRRIN